MEERQTMSGTDQQILIYARDVQELQAEQRRQVAELQDLYAALQAKEEMRARLMAELLLAQETERKRVAADLHDGPLQDLGVLLLSVERCKRHLESGEAADALAVLALVRQEAQQAIATLRELISDLRPAVLDTRGLLGALDYIAGQARDAGLTVDISSRIGVRLDPALEVIVFRLVQEALHNIRKHARAACAWVRLERQDAWLLLEVRDDGEGFPVEERRDAALAAGQIGLASMHERAAVAGGRLTIESAPQQGTVLRFHLPFQPAPEPVLSTTSGQ
jgi:two-component system sensor histidine kinase DegS